jgi:glucose/arabinose dehydrogenase
MLNGGVLMRMIRAAVLVLMLIGFSLAQGPASPTAVSLQPYLSGLTAPVFVTNAHDGSGRLFIVQQGGIIKVVQPGSTTPTNFLNIAAKVLSGGERGLLGLAFHPQYPINGRFFVYYTRQTDGAIQISEFRVSSDPNVALTAETPVITIPHPTNANHNGGTVAFGLDGYLYAGTGDGGSANDPPNNAQNINSLLGKMLRLDINVPAGQTQPYNIPPDNPYVGIAGADEIFAIGLRNPYRFSFDNGRQKGTQKRHRLWVADVGQGSIEEVDLVVKGGNYGWRAYEGTSCTNLNPSQCTSGPPPSNTLIQNPPIFQYGHTTSTNGTRCSITGGYVYRGSQGVFPRGTYVYADYCSGEIMMWDGASQTVVLDTTSRIVAIGQDEAGELYVVSENATVQKIVGAAPAPQGRTRAIARKL